MNPVQSNGNYNFEKLAQEEMRHLDLLIGTISAFIEKNQNITQDLVRQWVSPYSNEEELKNAKLKNAYHIRSKLTKPDAELNLKIAIAEKNIHSIFTDVLGQNRGRPYSVSL